MLQGHPIYISYTASSATAALDLVELIGGSTFQFEIARVRVGCAATTTNEQIVFELSKGTSSGSGGSAGAAYTSAVGTLTHGFTDEAGNTTRATGNSVVHSDAVNVFAGFDWIPTPDVRPRMNPSERFIVSKVTSGTTAATFHVNIVAIQLGGAV